MVACTVYVLIFLSKQCSDLHVIEPSLMNKWRTEWVRVRVRVRAPLVYELLHLL